MITHRSILTDITTRNANMDRFIKIILICLAVAGYAWSSNDDYETYLLAHAGESVCQK
jgi:hypothetical protein